MRSMEIHLGVVRDKKTIYSILKKSRLLNQQLAVCYKDQDKLIVKICTVADIIHNCHGDQILLSSPENGESITIPFDRIESIYPIRGFA